MIFSMTALKYFRPDYLEIKMEYGFDNKKDHILTEIVPKERFYNEKKFTEYIIKSMFDKAEQHCIDKIKEEIEKENQ